MRVLIVDDEPVSRLRLAQLCAQRGDLEIVGQAESGASAIEAIRQQHPDLVLLDVELQDMTGFDVLRALDHQLEPAAIMVTMHAHHALQAFDLEAVDYLTKPIDVTRFGHAIERALRRQPPPRCENDALTDESRAVPRREPSTVAETRLIGERARRLYFLDAATVEYIESDGNYVIIHVGMESYINRNTMQRLKIMLGPIGFVRIERSLLINLRRVVYFERMGQGAFAFTMRNGKKLVSSRSHRRYIIQELHKGS